MARVLALLILLILQGVLIVLLVNAAWVERQCAGEQARIEAYLGSVRQDHIRQRALGIYRGWFVESGAVTRSYERLLPDRTKAQYGMEGLAPWFFVWLERRLDAFWWLVFQAIYRAQVIGEWLPYIGLLAAVSSADGMLQRQVRRASAGYASADRYTLARRALMILGFLPFVYLSLPLSIHPMAIPIWGVLLSIALAVFAANAQHEV